MLDGAARDPPNPLQIRGMSLSPVLPSLEASPPALPDPLEGFRFVLDGIAVQQVKLGRGTHGPWKVPAGVSEASAFAVVNNLTRSSASIVVFKERCIFISDQAGRGKIYSSGQYRIRYQRGTSLFVTDVKPSCIRLSLYKPSDEHLGAIVLPHAEKLVKVGAGNGFYCFKCQKKFESATSVQKHFKLFGVPLKKCGKVWRKYFPANHHSRFAQYLKRAQDGVWDQSLLPSVSPEMLAARLEKLVKTSQTANSI